MRFLFLFTFHQLVDAWRKFANSASKVIMWRYNKNSSYRKIYLFRNKARYVNWKAMNPGFCEKMKVTRVPQVGNPCIRGSPKCSWEADFCLVSLKNNRMNWPIFFHRTPKRQWDHLVTPHWPQNIHTESTQSFNREYKIFCISWCWD